MSSLHLQSSSKYHVIHDVRCYVMHDDVTDCVFCLSRWSASSQLCSATSICPDCLTSSSVSPSCSFPFCLAWKYQTVIDTVYLRPMGQETGARCVRCSWVETYGPGDRCKMCYVFLSWQWCVCCLMLLPSEPHCLKFRFCRDVPIFGFPVPCLAIILARTPAFLSITWLSSVGHFVYTLSH